MKPEKVKALKELLAKARETYDNAITPSMRDTMNGAVRALIEAYKIIGIDTKPEKNKETGLNSGDLANAMCNGNGPAPYERKGV